MTAPIARAAHVAAFAVLYLASAAAPLHALDIESFTALSPDPDGGGSRVALSCGTDRVLIGVTGGSGLWIDRVAGLCIQVTGDGKWIGSETTTGSSPGTTGSAFSIRCPANSAVAALSGRAGSWLDRLQVHCRPLGYAGSVTGSLTLAGGIGGTIGSTAFAALTCAQNEPARSLVAVANTVLGVARVERVGLGCARATPLGLKSFTVASFSTVLPTSSRGSVALDRVTPESYVVTLKSDNPTVASVPATVTVNAGQSGNSFTIRPGSIGGCTTITASDATHTGARQFVVQYPLPTAPSTFYVDSPDRFLFAGAQVQGSVRVDGSAGWIVGLVSSNPNVVRVPPSVTIPKGATAAVAFPISTGGTGCAVISAKYGTLLFRRVVMVIDIGG